LWLTLVFLMHNNALIFNTLNISIH
jgi:hypothetical protein